MDTIQRLEENFETERAGGFIPEPGITVALKTPAELVRIINLSLLRLILAIMCEPHVTANQGFATTPSEGSLGPPRKSKIKVAIK
jgi:hypothetical protein